MGRIEINSENSNKLTIYQIAEAFSEESKEYIPKIMPYLKSKLLCFNEQVRIIKDLPIKEELKNFYMIFVDIKQISIIKKRIEEYEKVMDIIKNKDNEKWLANKHAIVSAKSIPIETLYLFEKIKMSTFRAIALCPFHSERTPSFVIYKKTNTYHCFSCKTSGDSINFIMKLNNINFQQAVKELIRHES